MIHDRKYVGRNEHRGPTYCQPQLPVIANTDAVAPPPLQQGSGENPINIS